MRNIKRENVYRHNSFLGSCAMARSQMTGIINASTPTETAKQLAYDIRRALILLDEELRRNRVDG